VGRVSSPEKVLLFSSVIFHEKAPLDKAISMLNEKFGPSLMTTPKMSFGYTDYYCPEMGSPLYRLIIAFAELVPRDSMPDIKNHTNQIEHEFIEEGKRKINLDPGLLTLENICLATTKPYTHRIYLGKGIWAEITLIYRGNSYQRLEWTYPDYGSSELIEIFNSLREMYRRKLKCHQV
jgi:hypothetical protein